MIDKIKNVSLEWGVLLLYLLPPVGIVWLIGIGCYHIIGKLLRKQPIDMLHPTTFFFCTLFLSSVVACLQYKKGIYTLIPVMLFGYFGLYLYIKGKNTVRKLKGVSQIIVLGGLYIALVGQFQLQRGYNYGEDWQIEMLTGIMPLGLEEPHRLFGSAYNPNFAAPLLLLALACLMVGILRLIKAKRKAARSLLLYSTLLIPLVLALIQTGSRTGVAVMVLLFLLFVWKLQWKAGALLLAALCTSILFTPSLSIMIPRFESTTQSFATRQTIWQYSLRVWYESPIFGITPLGFKEAYAKFDHSGIAHAHNMLLGFFCDYGLVGGVSFLLLVFIGIYKAIRITMAFGPQHTRNTVFFFSLPVLLLTGVFDYPLSSPQTALLAIILLAGWDHHTEKMLHFSSASKIKYAS
jgi:O-antigen ligase